MFSREKRCESDVDANRERNLTCNVLYSGEDDNSTITCRRCKKVPYSFRNRVLQKLFANVTPEEEGFYDCRDNEGLLSTVFLREKELFDDGKAFTNEKVEISEGDDYCINVTFTPLLATEHYSVICTRRYTRATIKGEVMDFESLKTQRDTVDRYDNWCFRGAKFNQCGIFCGNRILKMGGGFSKDGAITKFVEAVPGGGWITAPVHAAAGNAEHAAKAATVGFASVAATVVGGPAGVAVSAGGSALSTAVRRKKRGEDTKASAMQAARIRKYSFAALFLLLAGSLNLEHSDQPPVGHSFLKPCDGTVFPAYGDDRSIELELTAEGIDRPRWCIEYNDGKVRFKTSTGRFLSARKDGSMDLVDEASLAEEWTPAINADGSSSFKSADGRWLSTRQTGSVATVAVPGDWERFWINQHRCGNE